MAEEAHPEPHDAVAAAQAFLRQRDAIREALEAERAEVKKRLAEIDHALAALGAPLVPPPVRVPPPRILKLPPSKKFNPAHFKHESAPIIVKAVLGANPEGLTAKDLAEKVAEVKEIDGTLLHSTLYRLTKKTGEVVSSGDRGERIYMLARRAAKAAPPP